MLAQFMRAARRRACPAHQHQRSSFSMPSPKALSDVLLQQEPPEQVAAIWEAKHAAEERRVGATLSGQAWGALSRHARSNPLFVLPVAKGPAGGGGFVTFLCQWQPPHLIYTLLDEYMKAKDRASAHLVLTHYTELLESKGLVLARGEVVSAELSAGEARGLVEATHRFYTQPAQQRLVAAFNQGSPDFSFATVLRECGITPQP